MNISQMAETTQDLRERARDTMALWQDKAGMTARRASYNADRYVHEYAWTSIAFAVVAGCLLGFLFGRRD